MFAVVFVAGVILVLALGAFERRSEAFTLGVAPVQALTLSPNAEVCQRPIHPPAAFDRIRLEVGSQGPAPPVFQIRLLSEGRVLAREESSRTIGGRLAVVARVGDVPAGVSVAFCIRNSGRRPIELYGNGGAANGLSAAYRQGRRLDYDLDLRFLRKEDATLLALTGDMVERSALFRGDWVRPSAVWLLIILLLTALPWLLYRALGAAEQ